MDLIPILKEVAPLGVGGVIAIVIFYVGRRDYMAHKDELMKLLAEAKTTQDILISLVKENTIATTVLTEIIRNSEVYSRTNHFYKETGVDRRK
jgi:hypothetical protein